MTTAYGLSETAPILTVSYLRLGQGALTQDRKNEICLRTGIVVPLVQLRVVDEKGEDVVRDGKTISEIMVRAPWVFREYLNDPEKTRNAWRNG